MSNPTILPPLRRTAQDAQRFAGIVHREQTDKVGLPYFGHLSRVARRAMQNAMHCSTWRGEDYDEAEQIAWLHDVIEDTPYGEDDLDREGFSEAVIEGVCWLTRGGPTDPGGSYASWISALCEGAPLAVLLVKLSDNEDNADPERLAKLDETTRARLLAKYEPSMAMLREAARAKGWQG